MKAKTEFIDYRVQTAGNWTQDKISSAKMVLSASFFSWVRPFQNLNLNVYGEDTPFRYRCGAFIWPNHSFSPLKSEYMSNFRNFIIRNEVNYKQQISLHLYKVNRSWDRPDPIWGV